MASGLYKIQNSLSSKIIPCIRQSAFHSNSLKLCRNVASISINTGFAEDSFPADESPKPIIIRQLDVSSLRAKEKGDWRNLTIEEKQALYRMSFSQPFSDVADHPADDWKFILGTTFTAMGLMMLGMYFWVSKTTKSNELFTGPISFQNEMTQEEKRNIRSMLSKETD